MPPRLAPDAPCRFEGCATPRYVDGSGRVKPMCHKHMQGYWASRQTARRQGKTQTGTKRGRKSRLFIIDTASGRAQRIVGGVVIQDVALRGGQAHPHLATVMRAMGYKVQEA